MIVWLVKKGIFRNANHAIWFLMSVGIFLTLLLVYLEVNFRTILLIVPIVVHVPPLATSASVVLKNKSSEVFTKDCIWFNAVMILAYLIFFILV